MTDEKEASEKPLTLETYRMMVAEVRRFEMARNDGRAMLAERGIAYPGVFKVSIGPGWASTVELALDEMLAAGWDKDLAQIKQKFGGLCIYIGQRTPEIEAAINRAKDKAAVSCENCGKPHGLTLPIWGSAICDACMATQAK